MNGDTGDFFSNRTRDGRFESIRFPYLRGKRKKVAFILENTVDVHDPLITGNVIPMELRVTINKISEVITATFVALLTWPIYTRLR